MKPIIKEETQDTILTKDITDYHIVVAKYNNVLCILSATDYNSNTFHFKVVNKQFTRGDKMENIGIHNTVKNSVEAAIGYGYKVEVFNISDWKQALQWLIDNA